MGNTNILFVILPLLAVVLAGVSIAGLWYWWSSGSEETEEQPEGASSSTRPEDSKPAEPTVGDVVGKVTTTAQSWIANVARAAVTPVGSAAPTSGYTPTGRVTHTPDGEMVEVLRVLRDLADGSLVVEIGGKRYRNLAEIVDPQVKRRFMGNAQALVQFTQATASTVPQAPAWPAADSSDTEEPPFSSFLPADPALSSAPLTDVVEPAVPPAQPSNSKTMADEIEELIQIRLITTPNLMNRAIHIRQGAGGGIRVEVDGRYFDSVAGVTDPEITAFLQSVIREWEARQ